jgi:hypothetical protein
MIMMRKILQALLLVGLVDGFLVSSPTTHRVITTTTRLFAELPDISEMKASEMRKELETYGISTKSLLEKREFVDAVKKARAEGKKPINNNNNDAPNGASSSSSSGGSPSTREGRYQKAMEEAKKMKVRDLKKEMDDRGISTASFFEKSEFVKAYAEAVADDISGKKSSRQQEEPFDSSYREVTMQKIDSRQLMGQSVIDVVLGR